MSGRLFLRAVYKLQMLKLTVIVIFKTIKIYSVKGLLFIGTNFSWFLQNVVIHGFLNSWFQALHARVNGKIVFHWILIFLV